MLPGCCCIANCHIGARERRQLIPHVRFQVPFLGPESQLKSGFACAGLLCILDVKNTEKRIMDLTEQLEQVLQRSLNPHETLKLKGRLGFADGFLHGRLGALVLKRLVDHAYSFSNVVDNELATVLELIVKRLRCAGPKRVDANTVNERSIFTDASFETQLGSGGLGGVLVDCLGNCRAWFSLKLEPNECKLLGADSKETIIYELELLGENSESDTRPPNQSPRISDHESATT